ncbi:MAG TPA: hypothetical protein VNG33_17810 [Polyangiaceae bacterium]|nr:hypothetical protein [Polyangiaceae bacterium]
MDRRQRKLQDKKKKREQAKRRSLVRASRRPSDDELAARAGARAPFGPCFVSAGWDNLQVASLVTLVVTRALDSGHLLPHIVLVDRTCLGIKNAMTEPPTPEDELEELVETVGTAHGGMEDCEPLFAQSIIYHALDYAKKLGFSPHRDFHEALVGPRPEALIATPWHNLDRPLYVRGPDDDYFRNIARLRQAVGDDFEVIDFGRMPNDDAQWELDDIDEDDEPDVSDDE